MADTDFTLPDGIPSIERSLLKYIHHLHPKLQTRYDLLFEVLYQQLPEKQKADIVEGQIILHQCPAMPPSWSIKPDFGFDTSQLCKTISSIWHGFWTNDINSNSPLSPDDNPTGREPDLFWIKKSDLDLVNGAKFMGIPQLIIEILATDPEERKRDLIIKAEEYASSRRSWILDFGSMGRWTKFGTLTESSYSWTTWTHDEDPWIESAKDSGNYDKKIMDDHGGWRITSVNEINPYVMEIQNIWKNLKHQIDATWTGKRRI